MRIKVNWKGWKAALPFLMLWEGDTGWKGRKSFLSVPCDGAISPILSKVLGVSGGSRSLAKLPAELGDQERRKTQRGEKHNYFCC